MRPRSHHPEIKNNLRSAHGRTLFAARNVAFGVGVTRDRLVLAGCDFVGVDVDPTESDGVGLCLTGRLVDAETFCVIVIFEVSDADI